MADTDFEQFRQCFERLPQHLKATAQTYTLVHDLGLDDDADGSPSPSDADSDPGGGELAPTPTSAALQRRPSPPQLSRLDGPLRSRYVWATSDLSAVAGVGARLGDPPRARQTPQPQQAAEVSVVTRGDGVAAPRGTPVGGPGRRRRRLPAIPPTAKNAAAAAMWGSGTAGCEGCSACRSGGGVSLADELAAMGAGDLPLFAPGMTRPLLVLKCGLEGRGPGSAGSPDSQPDTLDSGHSTMHSPQLQHGSLSPNSGSPSPASSSADATEGATPGRLPGAQLELLEATHRGLYKFTPRHRDEIEVEIGDLIYVQKEADDLWCEGVNLRTGRQGCFPAAYAVDLEYVELDPSEPRVRRERFLVRYLGSVETQKHKGTNVLAAAVSKMVDQDGNARGAYTPCVLEVSDKGLRMTDSGRAKRSARTSLDYFYSLKHVSFCAYLPRDQRFLGFITKHPQMQRFACHVFQGQASTRPVAESVGRAFQRFYQKYVETAFPVEDIYID